MTLKALSRIAILAAIVAASATGVAVAQTSDPRHPDTTSSQATPTPESGDMAGEGQGEQSGQPGMMGCNMMQSGMGRMPMMGMRGFMFAIVDVDGDRALSFEEVTV